jgi:hypothetical protein
MELLRPAPSIQEWKAYNRLVDVACHAEVITDSVGFQNFGRMEKLNICHMSEQSLQIEIRREERVN